MKKVFRYLTKEKFEWMLNDGGIFVAPASSQSDSREGVYDSDWLVKGLRARMPNIDESLTQGISSLSRELMHLNRKNTYLSSWYGGQEETYEMWEEYGKGGVLIVSDLFRLIHFTPEPITQVTSYEYVTYCDFKKEISVFDPYKYKNEEFKYEAEFRMIFDMAKYSVLTGFEKEKYGEVFVGHERTPSYESEEITVCMYRKGILNSHKVLYSKSNGYVINFNLNDVILEIRTNPNASEEEAEYFRDLLLKAGVEARLTTSKLVVCEEEN